MGDDDLLRTIGGPYTKSRRGRSMFAQSIFDRHSASACCASRSAYHLSRASIQRISFRASVCLALITSE